MPVIPYFRQILELLEKREKRNLFIWTTILSATSTLDLLGVLLFGATFYVATNRNSYLNTDLITTLASLFPSISRLSSDKLIFILLVISLSVFLIKSFLTPFLYRYFFKNLGEITNRITSKFSALVLECKPQQIEKYSKQEVSFVLGDGLNNMFSQGIGALTVVISEGFLLISLLGLLLSVNPLLTLTSFTYFALIFFGLNSFMKRRQYSATKERIIATTERNHTIVQSLESLREIQLSGTTEFFRREYVEFRTKENLSIANLQFLNIFPKYFMEFSMVLGIFIIGFFTFLYPSNHAYLLLGLFSTSSTRILPSILRIQFSWSVFQSGLANSEIAHALIQNLLKNSKFVLANTGKLESASNSFIIEFKGVNFKYESSSSFSIKDIDLSILEFENIAVVGKSGSGKTTLIEMLVGNLDPDCGSLSIGGQPVRTFVISNPGAIGFVPQQIPIFNKTLAENIALGHFFDAIDVKEINRLVEKVGLAEYIHSLKDGISTVVGDSGAGLSGGQRQRIGIARALYYRPKILILDEATSALDAESENLITDLLDDKSLPCTKIVIAHRLSSIRNFKKIIYMDNGRILATGSFDYLRENLFDFDEQARLLGL